MINIALVGYSNLAKPSWHIFHINNTQINILFNIYTFSNCYNLLLKFITKVSPKMRVTRVANYNLCRFVHWRKQIFTPEKKEQNYYWKRCTNKLFFSGGVTWNGRPCKRCPTTKICSCICVEFVEIKSIFLCRLRYFQSRLSCYFTEVVELSPLRKWQRFPLLAKFYTSISTQDRLTSFVFSTYISTQEF